MISDNPLIMGETLLLVVLARYILEMIYVPQGEQASRQTSLGGRGVHSQSFQANQSGVQNVEGEEFAIAK
jgi:hypothetical protein